MRSATFATIGLSFAALLIAVACASSDEELTADPPPAPQPDASKSTSTIPPSSTNDEPKKDPPAKVCVAKCTSDSQCQSSCPAPSSGIACCDTSTGLCYTNGSGSCPQPQQDGGQQPGYL